MEIPSVQLVIIAFCAEILFSHVYELLMRLHGFSHGLGRDHPAHPTHAHTHTQRQAHKSSAGLYTLYPLIEQQLKASFSTSPVQQGPCLVGVQGLFLFLPGGGDWQESSRSARLGQEMKYRCHGCQIQTRTTQHGLSNKHTARLCTKTESSPPGGRMSSYAIKVPYQDSS